MRRLPEENELFNRALARSAVTSTGKLLTLTSRKEFILSSMSAAVPVR